MLANHLSSWQSEPVLRHITNIAPRKDIRKQIEAAFKRSAEVDARHVQVDARDNRVVLTGNVSNSAEREEAERVAWAAPGVTAVDNRVTVGG
jgi:osmotically-inducible protein OsmY